MISEQELAEIYRADPVLQHAVETGKLAFAAWDFYLWYVSKLGDLCENDDLTTPIDYLFVLSAQIKVVMLLQEHGHVPKSGWGIALMSGLQTQARVLKDLRMAHPGAYAERNQSLMHGVIPYEHWARHDGGMMTREDFLRINPKACVPQLAHFIMIC